MRIYWGNDGDPTGNRTRLSDLGWRIMAHASGFFKPPGLILENSWLSGGLPKSVKGKTRSRRTAGVKVR